MFLLEKKVNELSSLENKIDKQKNEIYEKIKNCKYDWDFIRINIKKYCRNSQVTAIAPTTSTSLLMGSSSSFLPVFKKIFKDKNGQGDAYIIPKYLKEKFWYYTENENLDQKVLVEIVGKHIQPWIDAGISMELLFNLNHVTVNDIFLTLIKAWKNKCKTVYYIRSIEKDSETASGKDECVSCSG